MDEIQLSPRTIEAIAQRVVELLEESREPAPSLVDAAELARRLGVSRAWVYEHAAKLEPIRLGDSAAPRIRFDVERVLAILAARNAAPAPPAPTPTRRGRPRRQWTAGEVELLPVTPP